MSLPAIMQVLHIVSFIYKHTHTHTHTHTYLYKDTTSFSEGEDSDYSPVSYSTIVNLAGKTLQMNLILYMLKRQIWWGYLWKGRQFQCSRLYLEHLVSMVKDVNM
jgi:hypothetical protein